MRKRLLIFLMGMFISSSLLFSLSQQFVTHPMSEMKKIDPELRIKSLMPQEKVKVIVWLNGNKSSESFKKIGIVKYQYNIIPAVAMEVSSNELEKLAKESNVERIVPDRIIKTLRLESMAVIKANNASSSFNVNGTGINISIIDTGIFNHTEFQNPNRITKQKCYCNFTLNCCPDGTAESDNATDDEGHGTNCAGIAAGKGDGVANGVATNASLFAVKVMNSAGTGSDSDLIAGIDWAVNNSANIISLSLGGTISESETCYSYPSSLAVDNATKQGVIVVIAAGNSGPSSQTIAAPGCAKRAITVGNTNDNDDIVSFSSRGPTKDNRTKPDLTAPGSSINSTYKNGDYFPMSGTSQATPHVAGVAALVMQRFNQINGYYPSPDIVKAILITAVNTTGMSSSYEQRNNVYGSGRIDAYEALRIANSSTNFTRNNTISAGQEHHYKINVTSADFKTTLYWPEDMDTNNNLNLIVRNSTNNISYNTDPNDTVEQVFIANASTGYWDVYISCINGTNQTYYLVSNMMIFNYTTAPALILMNPENKTYTNRTGIPLNFTTDSTNQTIWYRLDGGSETVITGNMTFNVSSDGQHNITLYVNDSYNNINQSTQYFSVDSVPPIITNSNVDKSLALLNENVNITANIDDDNLNSTWLNITWSGGSVLRNMVNSSSTYYYLFNETNQTGNYLVMIFANDTFGNINNASVNFTVADPVNVSSAVTNGSAAVNVSVKIFYNGMSQIRNQSTNTSFNFIIPAGLWDVVINTTQLNVALFNANLTQNVTRDVKFNDNVQMSYVVTNVRALKTVALKFDNFTFSLANVTFSFNSSLVNNQSNLNVYKCENWNFTNSSCSNSWQGDSSDATFNATININNVTLITLNFSAFSLGENQTTTTTTTTIAATTTTESSGDGGNVATTTRLTTSTTLASTTTITATTEITTTTTAPAAKPIEEEKTVFHGVKTWYVIPVVIIAIFIVIVWYVKYYKEASEDTVFKKLKEKWGQQTFVVKF